MNLSAISGLICAGCFVVPAIRQELRRREYSNFLKHSDVESDQELTKAVEKYMINNLIRWDLLDSIFILVGIFFLGMSFFLELS